MPPDPATQAPYRSVATGTERASARLRLALGLQRDGTAMLRQTLKRRFPEDTPAQRQKRVSEWLAYTPEMDDPRFEVRLCKAPSSTCSDKS